MLRARLIPGAAYVSLGVICVALAGCSSTSAPSWLTIKPPPPPTVVLRFESQPPAADVHTNDGQACKTPCSLALPLTTQSVSFGMSGYLPQTVPVAVAQSGEPNFQPNPVQVTLQPEKPPVKPKPRKAKIAAKTAAKRAPAPMSAQPSIMAPEPAPTRDDVFPPPPQMPAASSPFPPPPPR